MSDPQYTELLGLTIQQLTEIAEGLGQPAYVSNFRRSFAGRQYGRE